MPEKWGKKIKDSDAGFCKNFVKEYSKFKDISEKKNAELINLCKQIMKEEIRRPTSKDFDKNIQESRDLKVNVDIIVNKENIKRLISASEISKFNDSEKELKNHLETVRNRVSSINPEDVQDERLRKAIETALREHFIMDLDQFRNHSLDTRTCESQTRDIEDVDKRKALKSICIVGMKKLSNNPDFIRKAIDMYRELFQAKTVPDIINNFKKIKDPLKRDEMVRDLFEKKNKAIFETISYRKFEIVNPVHEKIEEAKKTKRRKISEETKDKIWELINEEKNWSQEKIAQKVGVSPTTVQNVAKKRMTEAEYEGRFQTVNEETKDKIWKLINEEKDWSLEKIAQKVGVGTNTVKRVAKNRMTEADYEERFKVKGVSEENKDKIWELINEKKGWSQEKIAQEVGVSLGTVQRVAKKRMTEAEYEGRFQTVSEKTKDKIWELINEKKGWSQKKIAQEVGVSITAVQNVAKERMAEADYERRFQTVSEKTKDKIMKLINEEKNWGLARIAQEVGVSPETVRNVAKKRMNAAKYKDRFPVGEGVLFGILFHEKITREVLNWGRKRGIRVLREKEIPKKIRRFKEMGGQPDSAIYVDEKFRKIFPIPIPPHIKYIVLDFSFDTSLENFLAKVERKYQSKNIIFYFIPIDPTDPKDEPKIKYQVPEEVPYRENIDALTLEQFFSTFNFTEEERKKVIEHFWDIFRKSKDQKGLQDFF
ncbi:MAG: hypothetical protein HWN67_03225 [Candidatus Helarchaeota archaeon]|nr:hypothetical protein [Candidatus Helarchaeota archaeon]